VWGVDLALALQLTHQWALGAEVERNVSVVQGTDDSDSQCRQRMSRFGGFFLSFAIFEFPRPL
jgi:hypothetical protein